MADNSNNRTPVEGKNLNAPHTITDEQMSGTHPVNVDNSRAATNPVVKGSHEVDDDLELKQAIANPDSAEQKEILDRAALARPEIPPLSKRLAEMRMNLKSKRGSLLTYEGYFVDMKDYLETDLVGGYSNLNNEEKRRKVVDVAIHLELSLREITRSFRDGRHHSMTFETKFSALETLRKILFAFRCHLLNPKAGILRNIVTNGHMIGWEKYVVEACQSFDEGELVLLAKAPPTETISAESKLAGSPLKSWLELFSLTVYCVNVDVFGTDSNAAKRLEGALAMVGGTPTQTAPGALGQTVGPTQRRPVELHNPSGLSIVHKR